MDEKEGMYQLPNILTQPIIEQASYFINLIYSKGFNDGIKEAERECNIE